jgi:hypothetical protein
MRGILHDFLHSLRLLRKSPGFTCLAVLCLALGIGVNTSVFSMLNYLFFRPLPVRAPDRLVVLSRDGSPLISWPDYRDLRDRNQTLEGMAASNPTESSVEFDGETHSAGAEAVSVNYPRVIGSARFWVAGLSAKTNSPPSSATDCLAGLAGRGPGRVLPARAPRGSRGSHRGLTL